MKYKALIDIGEYKKGEEVPEGKAKLWMGMYKESPVEKVIDETSKAEVEKVEKMTPKEVEEVKEKEDSYEGVGEEEKPEEDNSILEDYLARGVNVVKKNVSEDDLSKEQLEKLLDMENSNKCRKKVVKAIEERLKEM